MVSSDPWPCSTPSFLNPEDTGPGLAQGGSCLRGILTVLVHSRRANPLALLLLADCVTDGKRHIRTRVEELRGGGQGREGGRRQQVRAKRLIFQEKQRKVGRTRIQTWECRQGPSQHCPPLGFLPPASNLTASSPNDCLPSSARPR